MVTNIDYETDSNSGDEPCLCLGVLLSCLCCCIVCDN